MAVNMNAASYSIDDGDVTGCATLARTMYVTWRLPSSFSATSGFTMAEPRMESFRSDGCTSITAHISSCCQFLSS